LGGLLMIVGAVSFAVSFFAFATTAPRNDSGGLCWYTWTCPDKLLYYCPTSPDWDYDSCRGGAAHRSMDYSCAVTPGCQDGNHHANVGPDVSWKPDSTAFGSVFGMGLGLLAMIIGLCWFLAARSAGFGGGPYYVPVRFV
jgi:hypothetical protein